MNLPDRFVEISPARRIPVLRDRTFGAERIPGTIPDSSATAVASQMVPRDLVVGLPDAGGWPWLVKHTKAMKVLPGFAANLAQSSGMLKGIVPEKVALD